MKDVPTKPRKEEYVSGMGQRKFPKPAVMTNAQIMSRQEESRGGMGQGGGNCKNLVMKLHRPSPERRSLLEA